ncbi:MAG: O-antigen polymerase [Pseudoalteromonas distincta]|uniref:O-antigen polymerase n=1 Tax=Pseudoalteromonas distincta TaxID=77608 RepID=UPI0030012B32
MTDVIIMFLSVPPLLVSCWYLLRGLLNTAVVIYPVFFLFYVSPSFLNVIYGVPVYPNKFDNLNAVNSDNSTVFIYGMFISLLLVFFTYKLLKSKKTRLAVDSIVISSLVIRGLFILSISSLLLVLFAPNPEVYFDYGKIRSLYGTEDYKFYVYVSFSCVISALCILILRFIHGENISNIKNLLFLTILILDVVFNGKRLLMFFLPVYFMIGYFFSKNKKVDIIKVLVSFIIFISFYTYYTDEIKSDISKSEEQVYAALRIDFGRDDVLKFVINETLIKDGEILNYPGQTMFGAIVAYVPRSIFPNDEMKPYPYAQYLTNKLVYSERGAGLKGWTVTTSFIDELVSNFGWFGLLFVFLVYSKCFNYIDNLSSQNYRFYFYIVLAFLHVVHPHGIMPLVYLAFYLVMKSYFSGYKFKW